MWAPARFKFGIGIFILEKKEHFLLPIHVRPLSVIYLFIQAHLRIAQEVCGGRMKRMLQRIYWICLVEYVSPREEQKEYHVFWSRRSHLLLSSYYTGVRASGVPDPNESASESSVGYVQSEGIHSFVRRVSVGGKVCVWTGRRESII